MKDEVGFMFDNDSRSLMINGVDGAPSSIYIFVRLSIASQSVFSLCRGVSFQCVANHLFNASQSVFLLWRIVFSMRCKASFQCVAECLFNASQSVFLKLR